MNYGTIKERIRDLGFEDDAAIYDNLDVVVSSINHAINTIATTVRPIIGSFEIEQVGDAEGIVRYKLSELAEGFLALYKKPTYEAGEELQVFEDYKIENRDTVVLRGSFSGRATFYYRKQPMQITRLTEDDYEIELDLIVHELIPFLAAYHIWLDDDEAKATQYYNLYETKRNEIMQIGDEPVRIEFEGGLSWD